MQIWLVRIIKVPWDPLASEKAWGRAGEDNGDGAPYISVRTVFQVIIGVIENAVEGIDYRKTIALDDCREACGTDNLQECPSFGLVRSLHKTTERCADVVW